MVLQSHAPAILLTRPAAQSDRFAAALADRFVGVRIILSPLLTLQPIHPTLPDRIWTGVIFTSETAVLSARRIAADGCALPRLAFCVGDQTARTATAHGFDARSAQGDGLALLRLIQSHGITGPLLYLHGAEVRVDLTTLLNSAGIETVSAVVYAQTPEPLTPDAVMTLQCRDPVIAPLFSPRTGQILAQEYRRTGATAALHVVAISAAVAIDLPMAKVLVAKRPDAAAMLDALALWLA